MLTLQDLDFDLLEEAGATLKTLRLLQELERGDFQKRTVVQLVQDTGLTRSTVERGLAALRQTPYLKPSSLRPSALKEEHAWHEDQDLKGSMQATMKDRHERDLSLEVTSSKAEVVRKMPQALDQRTDTNLQAIVDELLRFEVLPKCVDILLRRVDPEVLVKQIEYHQHRLESGFPFRGHPAQYLYRACLGDWAPEQDFYVWKRCKAQGVPVPVPSRPEDIQESSRPPQDAVKAIDAAGVEFEIVALHETTVEVKREIKPGKWAHSRILAKDWPKYVWVTREGFLRGYQVPKLNDDELVALQTLADNLGMLEVN